MSSHENGRELDIAGIELVEDGHMLGMVGAHPLEAMLPVIGGKAPQAILAAHGFEEEAIARGGGDAFLKGGINLEKSDARPAGPGILKDGVMTSAHVIG